MCSRACASKQHGMAVHTMPCLALLPCVWAVWRRARCKRRWHSHRPSTRQQLWQSIAPCRMIVAGVPNIADNMRECSLVSATPHQVCAGVRPRPVLPKLLLCDRPAQMSECRRLSHGVGAMAERRPQHPRRAVAGGGGGAQGTRPHDQLPRSKNAAVQLRASSVASLVSRCRFVPSSSVAYEGAPPLHESG